MSQVWILMQGEHHEGGAVYGVFATRELGHGAFANLAEQLYERFGISDARQEENGALHLDGGCDWISLTPHEVTTQLEIPAGTETAR